jgi:hypothetical protein
MYLAAPFVPVVAVPVTRLPSGFLIVKVTPAPLTGELPDVTTAAIVTE